MVEKQSKTPVHKNGTASKQDQRKSEDKASDRPPKSVAVNRPGFDLGGSTGKTSAGTGLGLGQDAAESRLDRRLPGRRGKSS